LKLLANFEAVDKYFGSSATNNQKSNVMP